MAMSMTVKRKSGRPALVPGEKSTKEKIFDAAVELFAERGYDGVSIRDIAKAVGIRESSVYKHFETFLLRYEEGMDMERIERKSRAQMKLFVEMLKPEGN
jgi:AcrR family transcriptional regulator